MAALDMVAGVMNRLGSLIENEVNLHLNSKIEAQTLASNLQKINEVLKDAERKQLSNTGIKRWLEELRDVAYDIDDALEEWEIMQKQEAMELETHHHFWEKVCSLCSCFDHPFFFEHRNVLVDVQGLNKRVDEMYDKADKELKLIKRINVEYAAESGKQIDRELENSAIDESLVHGRDSDRENLKRLLLSYDGCNGGELGHRSIHMMAIVGVGGLGKTTLAKLIYNDSVVKNHFKQRIWVCVSQPFDQIRIAKEILEALGHPSRDVNGLESLMDRIKDNIKGKGRFLLVLDDVWTDDPNVWQPIRNYLGHGCEGSKVIVTTRSHEIARSIGATSIHNLRLLTTEETWSIISQLALSGRSAAEQRLLEKRVGRHIAEKCNGLPLAAKFLGKLLKSKKSVSGWQVVLHSDLWDLDNVVNDVFRFFFLSYNELDPAVKRCLSFCAILPKDSEIDVDDLIRMWIAQGFISPTTSGGDMESQGYNYFLELAHRSFFQEFKFDGDFGERVVRCEMHDIVHDFAQYLSKNECTIVNCIDGDEKSNTSKKASSHHGTNCRHLWIEDPESTLIASFTAKKLRSLICRNAGDLALSLLNQLKCVMVLSLAGCGLENIPDEIGNLVRLRYLDLSWNNMSELPESICNLYNLQTLDLRRTGKLKELPRQIFKLINLRHLLVNPTISEYPSGLQSLVNLQTLRYFSASRTYNRLGDLKNLNKLGGELEITLFGLDEQADVDEATNAALGEKESLQTLYLSYDKDVLSEVVEALRPPSSLLHLSCEGLIYPSWISSLAYLRKLELHGYLDDVEEASFPPLWKLESLEQLRFYYISGLKCLRGGFLGLKGYDDHDEREFIAFPKLQTLSFDRCRNWREWEDITEEEVEAATNGRIRIMPSLHRLKISKCNVLETLPRRLLLLVSSYLENVDIGSNKTLKKVYGNDEELMQFFRQRM